MPPVTDTRQRLIDAACELFWERGYAATGLAEILHAAGARGGSMYHFFPTKDDLLLAAIDQHVRVLETTLENAMAAPSDPADKALAVVEFYRRFMERTGCSLGCPLTNLAGEVSDSHPAAAVRIGAFNERIAQRLAECLSRTDAGGMGPESTTTARAVLSMLQGALLQCRAAKSAAPLDACADLLRSIVTPARRPTPAPAELAMA